MPNSSLRIPSYRRHKPSGESVVEAQKNIIEADSPADINSAAADKGYHSAETLALVNGPLGMRTYIP